MRKKDRKKTLIYLLLILLVALGIGYALLTQELNIRGTSSVKANSWNIYFDNLVLNPNNVSLSTGDMEASINNTTNTDIRYLVTLKQPGDFYEFTVDVVNDGSIDAMVGTVINQLNDENISSTNPLPSYLLYSATYFDGVEILPNHLLKAGSTETYKVRVEYKLDVSSSDLPTTTETLNFTFGVNYVQVDQGAISRPYAPLTTFSTDSWETIISNVQSGKTYTVGSTKEIELGNSLGTHTLRVANNTTPAECSTTGFSQTACGFVLEFADIITTHNMNPAGTYKGTTYNSGWNVDGWPASSMYAYLNDENEPTSIINSLPEVLRDAIIDTTAVSGHGTTSGETNFTSTDKLYFLSAHEVWEDLDGNTSSGLNTYDTSYDNTRQLDYYQTQGVTRGAFNSSTSSYDGNYFGAIKQRNGSNFYWWLRSADYATNNYFIRVYSDGDLRFGQAYSNYGVSPAFRLG